MTDYMTFDAEGRHTGLWYDAPALPVAGAVALTRAQVDDYNANWPLRRWNGVAIVPCDPPPRPAPTEADYAAAIQALLDATARERQYDSMLTAATYIGDPNPQFAAEAAALIGWRSEVWTYATAQLAAVVAGERAAPAVADLLAELPAFAWPS